MWRLQRRIFILLIVILLLFSTDDLVKNLTLARSASASQINALTRYVDAYSLCLLTLKHTIDCERYVVIRGHKIFNLRQGCIL